MRVFRCSVLGDNVEDVCDGSGMNVGVIDEFLAFLVESLIINVFKGIEYIGH